MAGILKNVVAIAAGGLDGLGLGMNAKAALVTRGLAEIVRFCTYFGAQEKTIYGLSGIGDLLVTSTSNQSRNWNVGYRLAKGEALATILSTLGAVAEGVYAVKCLKLLAIQHNIDMPILLGVYKFVYEGISAIEILKNLMGREKRLES